MGSMNWIQLIIAFILGAFVGPKVHAMIATKKI